ncbi:MAG: hypothetical protein DRR19_01940 [Candidatus Parabeggiatoa sp. nov. 1]|nr:MAG: hypothetical protein DRR19_01940 [Gammaproteobacteria bacterium]HEC84828.1 hypothetical protein [Thioploca sp.]
MLKIPISLITVWLAVTIAMMPYASYADNRASCETPIECYEKAAKKLQQARELVRAQQAENQRLLKEQQAENQRMLKAAQELVKEQHAKNERLALENKRLVLETQRLVLENQRAVDSQKKIGEIETKLSELVQSHRIFFLDTPGLIKLSRSKMEKIFNIEPPIGVPREAIAIIASIQTYHDLATNKPDHVNHSFGRNVEHDPYSWDNRPFLSNKPFNDVIISHEGNNSGSTIFWYGHHHGTQIIPLKSNGLFDAYINQGYSHGSHYITLQVYGYMK